MAEATVMAEAAAEGGGAAAIAAAAATSPAPLIEAVPQVLLPPLALQPDWHLSLLAAAAAGRRAGGGGGGAAAAAAATTPSTAGAGSRFEASQFWVFDPAAGTEWVASAGSGSPPTIAIPDGDCRWTLTAVDTSDGGGEALMSTAVCCTAPATPPLLVVAPAAVRRGTAGDGSVLPGGSAARRVGMPVTCVALDAAGARVAIGAADGSVRIHSTSGSGGGGGGEAAAVVVDCEAHVADVNVLHWFPSNAVVLSGASDMTLSVLDAATGGAGAVLVGHSAGVTGAAIIERGRSLVSCSRDGMLHLWGLPSAAVVARMRLPSPPAAIVVAQMAGPAAAAAAAAAPAPGEVGTSDKVVLAACEDGVVRGWHLGSKSATATVAPLALPAGSSSGSGRIQARAMATAGGVVAVGGSGGALAVFRVPPSPTDTPVVLWRGSLCDAHADVMALDAVADGDAVLLAVGLATGVVAALHLSLPPGGVPTCRLAALFTGLDCEAARSVSLRLSHGVAALAVGGQDGYARIYRLPAATLLTPPSS